LGQAAWGLQAVLLIVLGEDVVDCEKCFDGGEMSLNEGRRVLGTNRLAQAASAAEHPPPTYTVLIGFGQVLELDFIAIANPTIWLKMQLRSKWTIEKRYKTR